MTKNVAKNWANTHITRLIKLTNVRSIVLSRCYLFGNAVHPKGLHMRLRLCLAVLAVLMFVVSAAPANATTLTSTANIAVLQQSVGQGWLPTPTGTIGVHLGIRDTCPSGGIVNCSHPEIGQMWLVLADPETLFHELGHFADYRLEPDWNKMTPIRQFFEALIGHRGEPWMGVIPPANSSKAVWAAYNPPSEAWASYYAACSWLGMLTDQRNKYVRSPEYHFRVSGSRYGWICAFFSHILHNPAAFDQPTTKPPGPIPWNRTGKRMCGVRPAERRKC